MNRSISRLTKFLKILTIFVDIPHPPPKGLNAGVLLMNLTRMRNHGWVGKVLKTFDEYSTNYILNDQRLLNIYLRLNDGKI